ncbi:MAG TPA: hypothetical protein GXX49_07005 [Clostridiaceae bacterium]|nr:hypothetical protein [Clostridiaceae bacterium]
MTRLDFYRKLRKYRKHCFLAVILAICLLLCGLYSVDYSIGMLMGQDKHTGLFKMNYTGNSLYEFSIMNNKAYLNTFYLKREIQRIKNFFRADARE